MGAKITPPTRREPIVNARDYPSLRLANFFEELSRTIEELPEVIPDIADITVSTTANNTAKINEILTAMKTAGLMV